jgi:hypothetical protein
MSTQKEGEAASPPEQIRGWLTGRLPDDWFEGAPEILIDREEITVIGHLPSPERPAADGGGAASATGATAKGATAKGATAQGATAEGATAKGATAQGATAKGATAKGTAERSGAEAAAIGRSRRFREETRDARIEIAREAEHSFGRKVSWGVVCDNYKVMFTTLSIPVMTRLRQSERRVLDTLVDAGVARSRSDALAWCVRLVGEHEDSWLSDLREALRHVEQVRAEGPHA